MFNLDPLCMMTNCSVRFIVFFKFFHLPLPFLIKSSLYGENAILPSPTQWPTWNFWCLCAAMFYGIPKWKCHRKFDKALHSKDLSWEVQDLDEVIEVAKRTGRNSSKRWNCWQKFWVFCSVRHNCIKLCLSFAVRQSQVSCYKILSMMNTLYTITIGKILAWLLCECKLLSLW